MKLHTPSLLLFLIGFQITPANAATSISQYGITWTFDKDYPSGQFVTGDYWVIGPVKVIGISTDLHDPGFKPEPGQDGSMVNPGTTDKQGYDNRLVSYDAALNAGLVDGQPASPEHPLSLKAGSSLVSMVSWLYRSKEDTEKGCPKFSGPHPRPATRSGAILTVLAAEPPKEAFRPPYCGSDKTVKFTTANLDRSKLKNLDPVPNTPDVEALAKEMQRPWIDHVHEWEGAMVHPSENLPNYGQFLSMIMVDVSLALQLDFSKLPGHPTKDKLLIELVQYGIDSAGIADNGGGWPANGGHGMGRKWPILFAGAMLNDPHMLDVGHWKTRFQEDENTFYVTQEDVGRTHSAKWHPDKRSPLVPYEKSDIGMPEWGIWHGFDPLADNAEWTAVYRAQNGTVFPGFVLVARLMGLQKEYNHDAIFDYSDRIMQKCHGVFKASSVSKFESGMWDKYRPTAGSAPKAQ